MATVMAFTTCVGAVSPCRNRPSARAYALRPARRARVSAARPAEELELGQAAGRGTLGTPCPLIRPALVSLWATPPAGPRRAQRARTRPTASLLLKRWAGALFGQCLHAAAATGRGRALSGSHGRWQALAGRQERGLPACAAWPGGAAHRRAPCRRSSSIAGSRARWTRCAQGQPPAPPRPARPPPRSACAPAGTCARPRTVQAVRRRTAARATPVVRQQACWTPHRRRVRRTEARAGRSTPAS
jgi:hypothetical protein